MINDIVSWLGEAANRDDIIQRLGEHVGYALLATGIAALIAIPAGMWIGHTGRGRFAVVNISGFARAIPTLGLLYFIVLWLGPNLSGDLAFLLPSLIVLIVLAIPPMLAGTYAGIDEVDPAARDAARGMGMRGSQVLFKVEIPCALPLIFSGLRSALLQVVATATIAATAGLGGLGRFLIDGLSVRDYPQMAAGAVLVAALALAIDLVVAVIQRLVVSRGITGRHRTRRDRAAVRSTDDSLSTTTVTVGTVN
ncbi:ABC transporter permease [Terrabacter sp. MAHUQ-38]|uniref:ABC transporter permease n=1 Tax=unclassified Terrabacter TaxID=2630222 RepID=UPI00165E5AC6|nr:ABC transporter permease [Terrabacter sp. MAHUQ-38]MBC9819758.1 ABC transporter permease [Terrabacter sp. MAHUQ-38]